MSLTPHRGVLIMLAVSGSSSPESYPDKNDVNTMYFHMVMFLFFEYEAIITYVTDKIRCSCSLIDLQQHTDNCFGRTWLKFKSV